MTPGADHPLNVEPSSRTLHLATVLAAFGALRSLRTTLEQMQELCLTVDQAVVLAEVGVADESGDRQVDRVIRDLRQQRATITLSLLSRGLLIGGASMGGRYGLSEEGRELARTTVQLIEQEIAHAMRSDGVVPLSEMRPQ